MIKNDIALAIEKKTEFNRARSLTIVEGILESLKTALTNKEKVEIIPEDSAAFKAACKAAKIKVKKECAAFCVVGRNKVGALLPALEALAAKGITIHAAQAIAVGTKYGTLIEVAPKDVRKAAAALGV